MPAAVVYFGYVVGAVAVGYAFKEFVYEPHLAPKVSQWYEDFKIRREEHRRRRQRAALVPAPTNPFSDDPPNGGGPAGPSSGGASGVSGDEVRWRQSVVELQNLAERERNEWGGGDREGLRRRHGTLADSVSSLPLESLNQSQQHWQNSRPEAEDLISLSRSSTITMPTPRSPSARSSSATLSSVSHSMSPDAVSSPLRSPPALHASPRSPFVDVPGAADDFNLSDWTPASPGFSAAGSNLADSFAHLDALTPATPAPPRSEAASPFVIRDNVSVTSGSEDVSVGSDDDLSDLASNDGSDASGWHNVGRDP